MVTKRLWRTFLYAVAAGVVAWPVGANLNMMTWGTIPTSGVIQTAAVVVFATTYLFSSIDHKKINGIPWPRFSLQALIAGVISFSIVAMINSIPIEYLLHTKSYNETDWGYGWPFFLTISFGDKTAMIFPIFATIDVCIAVLVSILSVFIYDDLSGSFPETPSASETTPSKEVVEHDTKE